MRVLATAPSSAIYRLDPDTGTTDTLVADSGYTIVGAGVSTCAPLIW